MEEISLIFYGGEPLLSTAMISNISEKLQRLAHEQGLAYSFSLITNGTLLRRTTAEKLKTFGLKAASVTIDGPRKIHNRLRPFASGKGSFDVIIENLQTVCDLIDMQIGGNFMRDNYREFPQLLDYLAVHGLGPEMILEISFDPVFREDPVFALPFFHDGCASINEPWLFDAGIFLRREILSRGYRVHKLWPTACAMEQNDYLVINYDGSIYKCPGLIGRKEFCVGDLQTGLQDYQKSHNLGSYKNDECLECSYLPLCFGGCRYMKLIRDGNMEGVDCRKDFFDATLEAFVLQDIAYPKQTHPIQA